MLSARGRALALAGGAAVSVGIARFGYALILPAMRADLQLGYGPVGSLGTANAAGYLLGAIAVMVVVRRTGSRRLFEAGLWLTTTSLFACAATRNLGWLALWRVLAGVGAAGTFISGSVLAGALGGRAIAVFFSGAGLGMIVSGAFVPWIFAASGDGAWPWAWAVLGLICTPLSIAAAQVARTIPERLPTLVSAAWPWRRCVAELVAYGLFGLGYIAYMTFVLALLHGHAASRASVARTMSVTWCVLGLSSLAAPALWRPLLGDRKDGLPLACALAALAGGAAVPIALPTPLGLLLSAALVGLTVFVVPTTVTTFVKNNLPSESWGIAMAVSTVMFALGQALGPLVTGTLTDLTGSLALGLGVSAATLSVGAVVAFVQRPVEATRADTELQKARQG